MYRKLTATAVFTLTISLAACSGATAETEFAETKAPLAVESATPSPTPTPTPTPTETRSDRGNLMFTTGDEMTITSGGTPWAAFRVEEASADVKCTERYAEPVTKGMTLVSLDISVEIEPATAIDEGDFYLDAFAWNFIDANGVRFNGDLGGMATYYCLPERDMLPGG